MDKYYFGGNEQKLCLFLGHMGGIVVLETAQSGTYFAWEVKGGIKSKAISALSISL